jgi:hypothetical protein
MKLKLDLKTLLAVEINKLAYELEKQYPHLSFFEINRLVIKEINKRKLVLVEER